MTPYKKQTEKDTENKPITMRSTFIIGKDGKLVKEMRDIDIKGHVDEVVKFLQSNGKDLTILSDTLLIF